MYFNSMGDAANLQNHEIRTRKKVHVTRVGIRAACGGWGNSWKTAAWDIWERDGGVSVRWMLRR